MVAPEVSQFHCRDAWLLFKALIDWQAKVVTKSSWSQAS